MPIITSCDVLAVIKGNYREKTLSLCHYKYKPEAQRVGNGPLLAHFEMRDRQQLRLLNGHVSAANDYFIFLMQDSQKRWTFVTGQYDAELSVHQIVRPLLRPRR